jgi:ribonuclease G
MNNKLIITKKDNSIVSAFFEENDMVQVNVEYIDSGRILGNIYIGKIKNIVKNINAAFVEIANGKMCYLSFLEAKNPIFVNPKKTDKLVIGDELIVQVSKEDIKTKAPVITTNINFTGKYVVLIHGKSSLGISSKIKDESERKKIKQWMDEFKNPEYGFVVRTNATRQPKEIIQNEIRNLITQYEELKEYGIHKKTFSLLYQNIPGFISDIKDGYGNSMDEIVTDDKDIYDSIYHYLNNHQKEDVSKLRFYEDKLLSLSNLYSVNNKLEHALREKVWLKSGGTIIIQPTEALTVIDVNTGKAISGKKNIDDNFLKINREAAKEIAKQLRLRNISGIIIIDFITMTIEGHKQILMEELDSYLKKDPIKTTLVDMTPLNLVEITRKKVRKPLHEQLIIDTKDSEDND